MLPPALTQLKRSLEQKGSTIRSSGEDRLLEELETIDKDPEVKKSLDRAAFKKTQITSGPGNGCPCCGR